MKWNKNLIAKDKKQADIDCKEGIHDWSTIIYDDKKECMNCGCVINLK